MFGEPKDGRQAAGVSCPFCGNLRAWIDTNGSTLELFLTCRECGGSWVDTTITG